MNPRVSDTGSEHPLEYFLETLVDTETIVPQDRPVVSQLTRVRHLLHFLNNPHQDLKCIHVAGTNGKGSTCALIASILSEAGYRVGMFTSPHLFRVHERIRLLPPGPSGREAEDPAAGAITDQDWIEMAPLLVPAVERMRRDAGREQPTYFEVLTALALLFFKERGADWVVLETGLGGRLDATNAVEALIPVITSIDLDHTRCLGRTVEEIAREKAAIIKVPSAGAGDIFSGERPPPVVVTAPQPPGALEVIDQRCRDVGVKCVRVGRDVVFAPGIRDVSGQEFFVRGARENYSLRMKLLGNHQQVNAAVAVAVAECVHEYGSPVPASAVREGVARAVWPGRFEVFPSEPVIVLDAAHNPSAARSLRRTVREIFPGKRVLTVAGLSADKDRIGILKEIMDISDELILTRSRHPRAHVWTEEDLKACAGKGQVSLSASVPEALELARSSTGAEDVILVTGSIFVIAEVRRGICPD